MDKESASKVAEVLADAASTIRSLTSERDNLQTKVAAYERREEATKVACLLHEKGISRDVELPDLVRAMEKEAEAGKLPEIARAAEMIGPNMSFGHTNSDDVVRQGGDAFTDYILS